MRRYLLPLSGAALAALVFASPASALTMKECSTKYQAAKDAGTLGSTTWNSFRKSECGTDDSAAAPAPAPAAKRAAKKPVAAAASDDDAAGLSMKDCSTKYQAAQDANALNGLNWNDFRKAQCGPGASTTFSRPAATTASAGGKALTMAECSSKYQAAKTNGSLRGMKWNDFRKAQCSSGDADDDSVPSFDEASYTNEPEVPVTKAPRGVVFPRGIARKFASETPGKQRLHTCLEQYYSNKDNNTLNGLRWIQKGGGYYSLCNQRLKAGA